MKITNKTSERIKYLINHIKGITSELQSNGMYTRADNIHEAYPDYKYFFELGYKKALRDMSKKDKSLNGQS